MNPLYKPVDTESIKREIQSAQTVIELLLLMAAEKEAEKPARSGNFETTFTVDGQERKVERTPDGRFAATKKAVGDAAAAVGKAAGSAGKAVGDAAKGLLETDQEKFQKAWDKTSGIREDTTNPAKLKESLEQGKVRSFTKEEAAGLKELDKVSINQMMRDPKYMLAANELNSYAQNLALNFGTGKISPEEYAKESKEIFSKAADLVAKSFENNPSKADQVKKAIKGLPGAISKSVSDTAKSLQENSSKAIADAEAAFVMADKTTKEAIGNAQKSALDTLEKGKKGILDKVGATGKAASDAFSSVLKAASSAGDGVKKKVDAAKEKGKEIMASVDPKVVKNVGTAVSLAAGAATFGGIAGSAAVLAIGGGAIAGTGVAALTGLLGIAPAAGAMAAVAADWGTLIAITVAIDKNLFTQSDKAEKAVKSAFDDLAASIEKAKKEQEAKKEEPKEVSAAALDYLGYILGY